MHACIHYITLHCIALHYITYIHIRAHTYMYIYIYVEVSNAIHLLYTLICLEFLDVFPPPQTSIGTSDSCGPPSRRAMVCVYRPSHTSCLGMASKIVLTMAYLCISMHIYIIYLIIYVYEKLLAATNWARSKYFFYHFNYHCSHHFFNHLFYHFFNHFLIIF